MNQTAKATMPHASGGSRRKLTSVKPTMPPMLPMMSYL